MMNEMGRRGPASHLESLLAQGTFAIAAELSPPRSVNRENILKGVETLRGYADAINITDNQAASVHMSSLAVSALLAQAGVEPVLQMTCRDRNRLGLQADLLGAAALGIRNVLLLSGDHTRWGDSPNARNVFDLDSSYLIRMVRDMVETGCLDNGRKIDPAPHFFYGAVANPFAPPYAYRPMRLAKKVAAGARFIQTQLIYNVARFRDYMSRVRNLGLHHQVHIMAGVGPFKSARQAVFMATQLAGMEVPSELVERMERTPKAAQPEEGIRICCEVIDQVREIEGVAGLHIMPVGWVEAVPEIIDRSGLYPRPSTVGDKQFPQTL
jgi:methylenetetrahydrofolate reductase (NADPH)